MEIQFCQIPSTWPNPSKIRYNGTATSLKLFCITDISQLFYSIFSSSNSTNATDKATNTERKFIKFVSSNFLFSKLCEIGPLGHGRKLNVNFYNF